MKMQMDLVKSLKHLSRTLSHHNHTKTTKCIQNKVNQTPPPSRKKGGGKLKEKIKENQNFKKNNKEDNERK